MIEVTKRKKKKKKKNKNLKLFPVPDLDTVKTLCGSKLTNKPVQTEDSVQSQN